MRLVIDHREPNVIIKYLESLGIEIVVEQLIRGDYILNDNIVIERKSANDFAQSLFTNRLFQQIHDLIENYEQVILLIEDFTSLDLANKSFSGALAYLVIRKNVQIIPSISHHDTANLIERLTSWAQEKHTDPILNRVAPKKLSMDERKVFVLQGLVNVGKKTAQLLLSHFNSINDIMEAIIQTKVNYTRSGNPKGIEGPLKGIKGIGPKFVINNKDLLLK